jgi:hypothetical protein
MLQSSFGLDTPQRQVSRSPCDHKPALVLLPAGLRHYFYRDSYIRQHAALPQFRVSYSDCTQRLVCILLNFLRLDSDEREYGNPQEKVLLWTITLYLLTQGIVDLERL